MKELSIEQKAKAYDEALKVLHKYDGANIMFSQSLKEEMFPHLKENRIRKEIISMSQTLGKTEWIAWIEKQERKPNPCENCGIATNNCQKFPCAIRDGEQKSAEWSNEYEKYIADLTAYFTEGVSLKHTEEDIADWLKSLRPNHWKPSLAQMNALSIVSKGNAPDDMEAIVSLYQDLLKLREEDV